MKNKIRVIDVTIVSAYMGRYLTAVVALLVLAITLSAIFTRGGRRTDPLLVGVPARGDTETTLLHFEGLRSALARISGAPVDLRVSDGNWPEVCDLLVMSTQEFLRLRESERLIPLYSIEPGSGLRGAVLLAGSAAPRVDGGTGAKDILFTGPHAINGCWVQLRALERDSVMVAPRLGELEFAPPPGYGERVVYSVADGTHRYGAVAQHVLDEMLAQRRILPGEVEVVMREPPLPEILLCVREGDAANSVAFGIPVPVGVGEPRLTTIDNSLLEQIDEIFEYVEARR